VKQGKLGVVIPMPSFFAWQPGPGRRLCHCRPAERPIVNPSGKLPDSFPVKYERQSICKNFPRRTGGKSCQLLLQRGYLCGIYRYYDSFNIPVAYEFGYGLSYTSFEYSGLMLSSPEFRRENDGYCNRENSGESARERGLFQLYLAAPDASMEKPAPRTEGIW